MRPRVVFEKPVGRYGRDRPAAGEEREHRPKAWAEGNHVIW